ncbi:flagellar basal body rod protein FlgC, partial [Ruminococcaceae bacterium OttesenSCG-928-O06]|nr:flagellar basal body rod protein FlgC [Ruminococcaceae bacterium OttesenSCG-928-O06]
IPVYNPSHPDANEEGYVMMPNVDRAEENIDLMAASHSYNANITTLNVIKAMAMKAAEITK